METAIWKNSNYYNGLYRDYGSAPPFLANQRPDERSESSKGST